MLFLCLFVENVNVKGAAATVSVWIYFVLFLFGAERLFLLSSVPESECVTSGIGSEWERVGATVGSDVIKA